MIFSVIVPVHNGQLFLRECVESALHQDFDKDKYEIILVENGSEDESPKLCDEFAAGHDNVRALHFGKIGLYSARQEGIRAAQGEYIIALDCDDRLADAALKTICDLISHSEADSAKPDLVFYNAADMDTGEKLFNPPFVVGKIYRESEKDIYYDLMCAGDSINSMWTKCIKRELAYLGNEELFLNFGEDLYQTAQYIDRAKALIYTDRALYYYRQSAPSLTSSYSESFLPNQKIVWAKLDELSHEWGGDKYVQEISERKSLTCTIAVSKIIYSDMKQADKKRKLEEVLADDFYREFSVFALPSWAPEESRFVRTLQTAESGEKALLNNALEHSLKAKIKKILRK